MINYLLILVLFFCYVALKLFYSCHMVWQHLFRKFAKKPSTIFSQKSCVGVNTNSNLSGIIFRYSWVPFDVRAEWLSRISRILSSTGYFLFSFFKKHTKSELLYVGLTIGMISIWMPPNCRRIATSLSDAVSGAGSFSKHSGTTS